MHRCAWAHLPSLGVDPRYWQYYKYLPKIAQTGGGDIHSRRSKMSKSGWTWLSHVIAKFTCSDTWHSPASVATGTRFTWKCWLTKRSRRTWGGRWDHANHAELNSSEMVQFTMTERQTHVYQLSRHPQPLSPYHLMARQVSGLGETAINTVYGNQQFYHNTSLLPQHLACYRNLQLVTATTNLLPQPQACYRNHYFVAAPTRLLPGPLAC